MDEILPEFHRGRIVDEQLHEPAAEEHGNAHAERGKADGDFGRPGDGALHACIIPCRMVVGDERQGSLGHAGGNAE